MTVALRCFAAARTAAGRGLDTFEIGQGATLGLLLEQACLRYGEQFRAILGTARVWIDGDEPGDGLETLLEAGMEVAVLPPVSGG